MTQISEDLQEEGGGRHDKKKKRISVSVVRLL